jgi:hypothetical protein
MAFLFMKFEVRDNVNFFSVDASICAVALIGKGERAFCTGDDVADHRGGRRGVNLKRFPGRSMSQGASPSQIAGITPIASTENFDLSS